MRRDLVKILNRPRTTIYDHLKKLEKQGFVIRKNGKDTGRPVWGRPFVYWEFIRGKIEL